MNTFRCFSCMAVVIALLSSPLMVGAQENNGMMLEVQGDKKAALKALKAAGIKSVELKGSTVVLPSIKIAAPDSPVDFGEMIIVSAEVDRNELPDDLVELKYQWTVLEDGKKKSNVVVFPDNTKLIFAAGMKPHTFTVILTPYCLFEKRGKVGDKDVITDAEINSPEPLISIIQVGANPVPTPDPTPTPTPTPPPTPPAPQPVDPVFPPGKFGLSQFGYQTLKNTTSLAPDEKVKIGNALASSLEGIASKIAAVPNYRDVATILKDTKTSNDAAYAQAGVDPSKLVEFKKTLGDRIYTLYTNKSLNTADDLSTAWRELAAGFRGAK